MLETHLSRAVKRLGIIALAATTVAPILLVNSGCRAESQSPQISPAAVEQTVPRSAEVTKTTGADQVLPAFGADLFAGAPTTTTVNPNQPVPAGYRLGPGDKLRVRYWTPLIPETTHEVVIDRNGKISLPDIGDVVVSGLTQSTLRTRIGERLKETLKDPSFAADLIETRSVTVIVTGAAKRPGRYTVSAMADLFDVAYACGGPSDQGSMRRVQLRRRDNTVAVLDAYQLLAGGKRGPADQLEDGDVVFFPTVGSRVAIRGEVIRPALYEVTDGATISEILVLAGGTKGSAYARLLRLERYENGRRVERTLDAKAIAADSHHPDNLVLADGDVLTLTNASAKIYERVSIRGQVAFPGDYSTQRTPTVKALITEAKLRKGTFAERADLLRILDDGTPVVIPIPLQQVIDGKADDIPLQDQDEVVVYTSDEKALIPLVSIEGCVKHPATFRMSDGMKASDLIFASGGLLRDAAPDVAHLYRRTGPDDFKIIRISPAHAQNHAAADDPVLHDEDRLVIYKQKDVSYKPSKVNIVGEVQRPGEYRSYDGLTLYDLLLQAGGATDTAAGTVEVSVPLAVGTPEHRAEVKTFALADVTDGPHRDDIVIAGTLVSLPKRGDKLAQPWRVELKGRFCRPGTYALLYDGETLDSLLKRAGGFADNADPFGLSLTRTRDQMLSLATAEQLKTVMDTMDQLLPPVRKTAGEAPGKAADVVDMGAPASISSALPGTTVGEKVLLVSPRRLSEMPTGKRIAFDMEDRKSYIERLGKVRLADGDIVEVPRQSEIVQVLGAVQSPGPIFYQEGYSANDYIHRAGGGAPDADMGRAVVIKVSGTVRPLVRDGRIDRGDVIVVASKYQVIQPPRKRTMSDVLLDLVGVALVVRGLR